MKKVLYSDLDGTLFRYNEFGAYIDINDQNAINKWTESNYFGIATGRNIISINKHFNDNNLKINMPYVLINGALVYDHKNDLVVYQDKLNKEVIIEAINYANKHNLTMFLIGARTRYYVGTNNDIALEHEKIKVEEINYDDISKINFVIDKSKYHDILKDIKKFDSFEKLELVPSSMTYIEIVNKGVSKYTGIIKAINYMSIEKYHLSAIGDYLNDYEMLKNSDLSFVPENGLDSLKELANYKVKASNNNAVANTIEILSNLK
ncbi:HAD-IIB family hydrolase [Haploplasma modicum]|uniref:HAD-IIB family hydrolase n=1 Tax=Haploplasma modicum TaxID=2150 RepID=UPI00047E82AE|nr:HAD-IIB family hydrolase [Haploplasma modicum]